MKKDEIVKGGLYRAMVGGKLTTVRVDLIREVNYGVRDELRYDVTNMVTQRRTTFRSAAKFRSVAEPYDAIRERVNNHQVATQALVDASFETAEGEQSPPFLTTSNTSNTCDESPTTTSGPTPCSQLSNPPCELDHTPSPASASTAESTGDSPAPCDADLLCPESAVLDLDAPTNHTTITRAHVPADVFSAFASVAAAAPTRKLTDEQAAIIEAAPHEQVLVVEAGAGAGKTSTMVAVADALRGRGQYTAFNASLVAESKAKFPDHCPCNTIHSLAFRSEGRRFAHRLGAKRVMGSEVAAMLGVGDMVVAGADGKDKRLDAGLLASQVTKAVRTFCQSADREVGMQHFAGIAGVGFADTARVQAYLLPFAVAMWEDMSRRDGTLPYTHDAYVKVWQLGDPVISADYVLLDEAQDTSPVMLDVLAQQVKCGTRVILVGDSAQQIYSWRGAVNALAAFPDAKRLMLSMSFRFGQVIAEVANAVLGHLRDKTPLVMRGFEKVRSRLGELKSPHAVLCRTNAAAVQTMLSAIAAGKRPHLIGGGDEVLKFVNAARDLQQGKRTHHPELESFDSWGEVKTYSATDEGEDLKLMVKLVGQFGAQKIADALKRMPAEAEADLVVSTAHKSKGREWDTVRLTNDFMPLSKMGDEELRLLYVAATRARLVLDVEQCAPFCGGEREVGNNGMVVKERAIDLREARRLSKLVGDTQPGYNADGSKGLLASDAIARGEKFEGGCVMTAPQVEDKPAEQPKYKDEGNTWTKSKRGEWCVRGKPGQSGVVEVVRRNGSKSREKLGRVIWADAEVALYAVEEKG